MRLHWDGSHEGTECQTVCLITCHISKLTFHFHHVFCSVLTVIYALQFVNHIVICLVSVVLSSKLEGSKKNETLLFACMLHYSVGNFFSKKFGIFGGVGVTTNVPLVFH